VKSKPVTLNQLADAILEWAKTPGPHGGNPYTKEMVKLAQRVKETAS